MTKRKRSSSSCSGPLVSTSSTRSSARKPVDFNTDVATDQHARGASTPSTQLTDQSTELQNSPSSSRTSSNIIDASPDQTLLPDAMNGPTRAKTTRKAKTRDTPELSMVGQVSNETPDRPGRRRKPTQKAAELAANSSSKLFKSIGSMRIKDDNTLRAEQGSPSEIEHVLSDDADDGSESNPASEETTCKGTGRAFQTKHSANELVSKTEEEPMADEEAEAPIAEASTARLRGRKQLQKLHKLEESPTSKHKSINTQSRRSRNQTSAVEINIIPPDSPEPTEAIDTVAKPTTAPEDEPRSKPHIRKPQAASQSPKISTRTTTHPTIPTQVPVEHAEPTTTKIPNHTITDPPDLNSSTIACPSAPTSTTQKPTRIKFKPLQPTTSSALEGYTGLPCHLSCLPDSSLYYIWATISIEQEELAEEMCDWEGEFDADMSEGARRLRGRLNRVMAEFCVCGRSEAVACKSR